MTSSPQTEPMLEAALTRNRRAYAGWVVAGAVVLVLMLTAFGLVWRQYDDAKGKAEDELRSRAILAATVFDTYFSGQIAALSAIAASPTVRSGDPEAMTRYFARFRPGSSSPFTAGVGWIDLRGRQRATSAPGGPVPLDLADRTYFRRALATKKPFVSEAIVARTTDRRLVVVSLPTRDDAGRVTGVLAGGIVLEQSPSDPRSNDLGYEGLQVVDRRGQQITRRDLARVSNAGLLRRLRETKQGLLAGTHGLDGSPDRVVAYASSATPGWTAVIDRSTGSVFADARRSLVLEALIVLAASFLILGLIVWGFRRSQRDVHANSARVSRWARLTRSLNQAADPDEVRLASAESLAAEFPDATVVVTLEPETQDGGPPTIVPGVRAAAGVVDERVTRSVEGLVTSAEGPVALETHAEVRASIPSTATRARSLYGVSLRDDGSQVGTTALLFGLERGLRAHELAFLQAHVDQVAHALARIRRHRQEHDVALLLQQSLLPVELPSIEGLEVGAFYRAGVANTSVGGDWYDVVRRPDGIVHLTVGDVAGRGIDAAVAMGQLRNAFRAYALDHASPAAVIERLARHVEPDAMATTACVTYDPYTGELLYAGAGHLPPLVVDAGDGVVTRLDRIGSPPLGWLAAHVPEESRADVPLGATLVLYTDGLVERRGASLEDGIARLASAVSRALPAKPSAAVERVVADVVGADVPDDLALLLVHVRETPSVARINVPADPHLVRDLRRRVKTWLERRGLDEQARYDAVLAMSEACNNAIEHGYGGEPGTIKLCLEHRGDALSIRIADNGSWREPPVQTDRGRGIPIMQGLMEVAEIVRRHDGTEVLLEQRL